MYIQITEEPFKILSHLYSMKYYEMKFRKDRIADIAAF